MFYLAKENPHVTTKQITLNESVSQRSLYRTLIYEHFRPYNMQLVQGLVEDDFDRRVEFCEEIRLKCETNHNFYPRNVFTNEPTFNLDVSVNKRTIGSGLPKI